MRVSSLAMRFIAHLIDLVILVIPTALLLAFVPGLLVSDSPVSDSLASWVELVLELLFMIINCLYFPYFLSSPKQASPGQRAMGIYTARIDNRKIDFGLAFSRSISQFFLPTLLSCCSRIMRLFGEDAPDAVVLILSFVAVMLVMLEIVWYAVALLTKNKQTVHDIIFGTVVVERQS